MKYVCAVCGYIYDEDRETIPFSQLSESWVCPVCKAAKSAFSPEQKEETPPSPSEFPSMDEDMEQLSSEAVAALFSNLARGCEKQYKEEESALFLEIANYFSKAAPPVEETGMDRLSTLLQGDLKEEYPSLKSIAASFNDRGTQRICVWGEKVTNMQKALLDRYLREGEELLKNTQVWVCTVCGFLYIGDVPPQLCPVCKVPPWKFEKIEGRKSS